MNRSAVFRVHPLVAAMSLAFTSAAFAPAVLAQSTAEAGQLQTGGLAVY